MPSVVEKKTKQQKKEKSSSLIAPPPHELQLSDQKKDSAHSTIGSQTAPVPQETISDQSPEKPVSVTEQTEKKSTVPISTSQTPSSDQPRVLITKTNTSENPQSETSSISTQKTEEEPVKVRKSKKKIFIFTLLIIFISLASILTAVIWFSQPREFLSPVPDNPNILSYTQAPAQTKEIIGFLPFWNMKEEKNLRYHLLSQVIFFALEIDQNGNIKKLKEDGTEEPGWTAYKSEKFGSIFRKAKNSGSKVSLTIQAMNQDSISGIVNNPTNRKRAIQQTLEIINSKNLDGVNIDFEYAGAPPFETTRNFTKFVTEFRNALTEMNPNLTLTVDVFADSAKKVRIWDIDQLVDHVDHIIVMAYDFHRANSRIAAPVAPIRGSPKLWEYDIVKTLADFSNTISLDKVILGIPYYGYEWRTTAKEKYATTFPNTGSLATYKRIQILIDEKNPILDWDETALAPRLVYTENGRTYQSYYENETSLGLKYDLVNESQVDGIAIWALGYDGQHANLWNLLTEKFFSD
jgi:spore germination protein YaaH